VEAYRPPELKPLNPELEKRDLIHETENKLSTHFTFPESGV
jgi:hypothetical protein